MTKKQASEHEPLHSNAAFAKSVKVRLIATEDEKIATSKSLYFDHGCRISSHPPFLDDKTNLKQLGQLFNKKMSGKRVLFIGATLGLGILPMMAVRNGASRVVSVDDSAMIPFCQQLATENKLSAECITFLRGNMRSKDLKLPADCTPNSFDVVYCDWVSTFVINDISKIVDCLYARDMWLKKSDGIILPPKATLSAFAVSDYECYQNSVEWWSNVYGFKMETMRGCVLGEPFPGNVWPQSQKSDSVAINTVDIMKLPALDISETESEQSLRVIDAIKCVDVPVKLVISEKCTVSYVTLFASCEYSNHYTISCGPDGNHNPYFAQSSLALPVHLPMMPNDVLSLCLSILPQPDIAPPRTQIIMKGKSETSSMPREEFKQTYHHAEYR